MGKNKKNKKQFTFIPEKFLERLTYMFGVSLFNQIKDTFVERPTTFRVNTLKANKQEIKKALFDMGFKLKDVSWYGDAFVLLNKSKRELTDLEIYKQGKIYIQSLASMVPPLVLDPQAGDKVLDLTAAPGSKTSQIAALMKIQGEFVANDNSKIRFFKLKHNMELLGVSRHPERTPSESTGRVEGEVEGSHSSTHEERDSSTEFTPSNDGAQNDDWTFTLRMEHGITLAKEYPEYFDKILLDAPCSAETRFLSDKPKTFSYWDERKVKEMAFKQAGLLRAAWGALKPGGILVYSTCTFAPEENELQISRFMEQNADCEIDNIELSGVKKLPIVKSWKNKEINKEVIKKALRIMPDKEIEGFFVVRLRKQP